MKNHPRAGFSLLEIAIVLIIIGIVVGAGMPSILKYRDQARLRETKERQEVIVHAVAAYAVAHGALPCPADPSTRGEARTSCLSPGEAIGVVPYRSLGLSESQTKDAYQRYMTYAVPISADGQSLQNEKRFCAFNPSTPLSLMDQHGLRFSDVGVNGKDVLALILISHGPSGHGAFTGKGLNKVLSETPGAGELGNADETMRFYDLPYSLGERPFRHIVKWVTKNNLMSFYGRQPCVHDQRQNEDDPYDQDPFGRG